MRSAPRRAHCGCALRLPRREDPPGIPPSLSPSTASSPPVCLNPASSRLPGSGDRKLSQSRKSTFLGARAALEVSLPLFVYSLAKGAVPGPARALRVAWPPCLAPVAPEHLVSALALLYPRSPQRAPSRRPMTVSRRQAALRQGTPRPRPLVTASGTPGSSLGLGDAARCWGNMLVLVWGVRRGFSERRGT